MLKVLMLRGGEVLGVRCLLGPSVLRASEVRYSSGQIKASNDSDRSIDNFLSKYPHLKINKKALTHFCNEFEEKLDLGTVLDVVTGCPEVLRVPPGRISESLDAWIECNFGSDLGALLSAHPSVLLLSRSHIAKRYANVSSLLSHGSVFKVILNSPLVLVEPLSDTTAKFSYLKNVLKYSDNDIVRSSALNYSYSRIRNRFQFIIRTGVFKIPRTKTLEVDKLANPRLGDVLSLNDHDFSYKIAQVTLAEFRVFIDLMKEEEDSVSRGASDLVVENY